MNRLEEMAFIDLIIACEPEACGNIFQPTIDDPASDPVEEWAKIMAKRAEDAGWTVESPSRALCPEHSE